MIRDALVAGISSYQYLPSLNAPAHDAEAIAQRLQTDGDFRLTRLPEVIQAGQPKIGLKTQVSLAELETALVRLFKPKGSNIPQTALFYFSGHGLQKDAGIQEGYLATSDANPSAGFYGLSLFWLRRLLQESPVRQRIILLDCCHSGELLNFLEADPGAKSGTDRLFMAASREYESAYESIAGQYSVFTQALLDGLDPNRITTGTVTNYALTDWVSNALKAEMQQPLFENSGSEIVLTRCQGARTVIKTELTQDVCPYRGLEFFDEAHADYFFGREELTDQLIEKLKTRNFVAVVGASGSGKSSLIRAGLIHKLRQGQKFSGSDRWRIQVITPTDQPLRSLATAFVNPKDSAIERAEQLRRAEALLREGGSGLYHLVRASLMTAKQSRNSRLLLIIDQFEEVFTLSHGPQAERDRYSFFNCLLTALKESSDCLSIVVVLRADFFAKYSFYQGLAQQIEQNLITVTPLTYEQIKASVVKPAQKTGLVCEPNLVYNILLDIVGAPGELPLLQYTLLELWQQRQPDPDGGGDRLTLDAYNKLGGVQGTLQKRANEIFYSLTVEEQRVAKRIFIALTQIGDGTEDTRRRVLKSELVSPQLPAELVERVIEKLVSAKLIVTNRVMPASRQQRLSGNQHQERVEQQMANVSTALRFVQMRQGKSPSQRRLESTSIVPQDPKSVHPATYDVNIANMTHLPANDLLTLQNSCLIDGPHQEIIDVAHEALIRNWSLLRVWLDENRERLQRQRKIEHVAREWHSADQPRSAEYLLHGDRLVDAEDYLHTYSTELSILAQQYITVSKEESRRTHQELRLLQIAVPFTLLIALVVTSTQYWTAVRSQAEKDYQLQIATSRQQAAIAQSILQEPSSDPTTALLISRIAAKSGYTYEAEASLRAALQKLKLQANLRGHQGAVHQVVFSPNQRQLATAGEDGTIRIWALETQTVEQVLSSPSSAPITFIVFSPDGRQIAAIAKNSAFIQIWSLESGSVQFKLGGFKQTVTQLAFSPTGAQIAVASADSTVRLWSTQSGVMQAQLFHRETVHSLEFSPDGRSLVTASGNIAQLWQISSRRIKQVFHHHGIVNQATFNVDGQLIATACEDGRARLWVVKTGQLRHVLNHGGMVASRQNRLIQTPLRPVKKVLFSPNGQLLATAGLNQWVRLWDVKSGQLQSQLRTNEFGETEDSGNGTTIAFSPNSQRLITTSAPSSKGLSIYAAYLWNLQTGQQVGSLRGHAGVIESLQFSGDGSLVATASADGSTRLWAAETGSEFPTLNLGAQLHWAAFRHLNLRLEADSSNTGVAMSLNQLGGGQTSGSVKQLMTVAGDGTIRNWNLLQSNSASDTPTKPALKASSELQTPIYSLPARAFHWLKSVSNSIWFFGNQLNQPLIDRTNRLEVNQVASSITPVAAVVNNRQRSSTILASRIPARARLTSVALSTGTPLIATADEEGTIELWQAQPGQAIKQLRSLETSQLIHQPVSLVSQDSTHTFSTIRQLSFSPDSQQLLGVGDDRAIWLWDVATGKLLNRLQGHKADIEQAQFSANGHLVVSASKDHTARIWQVFSGQLLTTLQHQDIVNSARFSPDGRQVITTSWDGTARIMDRFTGAWRVVLAGHQGAVLDAQFSPDGEQVITASADGTARLWDAKTGTERMLLRPSALGEGQKPLQQAFFSPDGRYVAALSKDGQLNIWVTTWTELLKLAQNRSLRQLKTEECLHYRLPPNSCSELTARD